MVQDRLRNSRLKQFGGRTGIIKVAKKKVNRIEASDEKASYLGRVFALLKLLAERGDEGARVPEICHRFDIHRVTAHRLLRTLVELGYIEQSPDLAYRLGFEAWALGLAASRQFVAPAVAAAMKRISDASEECVFLMRRAGNDGVCTGFQEGAFPFRSFVMRVGTVRPLGIGGTSVALLAALPAEQAEQVIRNNAAQYQRHQITEGDVRKLISDTRKRGYAYSQGAVVAESRTLAVSLALIDDPGTMMSMSIITLESRIAGPRRSMLAKLLQSEAATLARTSLTAT